MYRRFLKKKRFDFQGWDFRRHIWFFWYDKSEPIELVGYFTIASKFFTVSKEAVSNTTIKKISKYGAFSTGIKKYVIAAPLIAQLGKNYTAGNNLLISGDELLKMAIEKVKEIQNEIGGKFTYLECEDVEYLKQFYRSNGFQEFGKRELDRDETDLNGKYLVQFLKYIHS